MNQTAVPITLVLLLVTGCGQTGGPELESAPSSSAAESGPVSLAPSASAGEPRLPAAAGPPKPLEAGTYLTPEGFEPVISVTVPDGWYGAAGSTEFGVGQGLDEVNQRFEDVGLQLAVIAMPYDEAVAAFQNLEGLTHEGEPTRGVVDGHESTTFRARAAADHVVLDPVIPGADISSESSEQIFIDVDGTTVLIRTEVFDPSAEPALDHVLSSLTFP